jgi:DNA-binding CsgD family transcriptional regulator
MLEKMEEDVETGEFYDVPDDGRDYTRPGDCRAIVDSSGKQCTAGARDSGLCGTHERSSNLLLVDDVPGAPFADLRDALVDAGLHGPHAYRFATRFRDVATLWDRVTSLEPIEIGDKTYDADALATHAKTIADHPELDIDDHPLAFDNCIATTKDGRWDKCKNGAYGRNLLCGTHEKANDPETILDPSVEGPDFPRMSVDGGFADFLRVDELDDDVIGIDTDSYVVERRPKADFEPTDPEDRDPFADEIDPFVVEQRAGELEDVGLSGREAQVVARKEQGLTHEEIADEIEPSESSVDEYSRRARRKIRDARKLVDEMTDLYE